MGGERLRSSITAELGMGSLLAIKLARTSNGRFWITTLDLFGTKRFSEQLAPSRWISFD
jgi:hypothetical protein